MTTLRKRLIEDMQVRNYSPRTVQAYVAAVVKLARHFGRSPDQLAGEDLRAFQVALLSKQVSWSQFNQVVSGLRFFYGTTLGRPGIVEMLPYGKRPKRLPTVLSVADVRAGRRHVVADTSWSGRFKILSAAPRPGCAPSEIPRSNSDSCATPEP